MNMSEEQLLQVIARTVAAALQQAGMAQGQGGGNGGHGGGEGGRGGYGGSPKKLIDTKSIRIRDFDGEQSKWEAWAHSFKSAIRSACPEVLVTMEEAEKMTLTATDDNLEEVEEIEKKSGEMYNILSQYCTGEALNVIKGITSFQGFHAWQKLYRKYNPKTMARAIRLMTDVTGPKPVKEIREVEAAITLWETRVTKLHAEFNETMSPTMKIAILTGMMPTAIQDYVYTNVDDNTQYQAVVDKIRTWAGNKTAMMNGPVPMDIGEVSWDKSWDETYAEWEEAEVQAVGPNTQCHRCGGWGHMARECATEAKGKGKGNDSKGKGKGKGNDSKGKGKGKGDDGKGKGKGYQGTCWTCGKVGHKSHECRSRSAYSVEEEIVEEADVGGVWTIGNVEVQDETKVPELVEAPPGLDATWTRVRKGARLINWGPPRAETEHGCSNPDMCRDGGCRNPGKAEIKHECRNPNMCRDGDCRNPGKNMFEMLKDDGEEEDENGESIHSEWKMNRRHDVPIGAVRAASSKPKLSRESRMKFNVAKVQKPLASAVKVVEAGNRISMGPKPEDNFIENSVTGEKIGLRVEKGTFVFDVEFKDGEAGTITLDSGAGVNVWPENVQKNIPMLPKDPRLRMTAANGSEIPNLGMKMIEFRGCETGFTGRV